jgi:hypothetical protein
MGVIRANQDLPAIIGDTLKLTALISGKDRVAQISFPYMGTVFAGAGLAADVTAFGTAWVAAVTATLVAVLPTTSTLFQVDVAATNRLDVRTGQTTFTTVGTVVGNQLAENVAAVIVRGVAVKGQHGRGRVMMPQVPSSFTTPATDPNVLNATGQTAYTAFLQAVFGTVAPPAIVVNGHSYYPAILQKPDPGSQLTSKAAVVGPAFCFIDVTLGTVRNRIRRRR